MSPLRVLNFSLIGAPHSCFTAEFANCMKRSRRRKRKEEKTLTFADRISEIAKAIFFKF